MTRHAIAFLVLAGSATATAAATATVLTLATATSVSAQQDSQEWLESCRRQRPNRDRERFCEVRTETFRAGTGTIRIHPGQNGGVSVESGTGSEIEVEARIQAESREEGRATSIAKSVDVGHSGNNIVASGPDMGNNENWSVTYVVRVPRNSDLDIKTTNGPIGVRNVRGRIVASTINGPLALADVAGDVRASTTNGPLSVRLSGARWEGAGLDAETSNGPVTLTIPDDYNANLEAGTTNGPFTTEIPLSVKSTGRERSTRINTKIGDGGAPVRVNTTNGPIQIRKR